MREIILTTKEELLQYKAEIISLFAQCFDSVMDEDLWQWAYIDNPCGAPIVSLCFDQQRLIGHYAIIPIFLQYMGETVLSGLSMTTMVDAAYRGQGIFVKQAKNVYAEAKSSGYSLVYGFPNQNSAPGFLKKLEWNIDSSSFVVSVPGKDLPKLLLPTTHNKIHFATNNSRMMSWRLSKPFHEYRQYKNVLVKHFNQEFDVVFHEGSLSDLDESFVYNIYVDDNENTLGREKFMYVFGYKLFDEFLQGAIFKKDLLMSDVF